MYLNNDEIMWKFSTIPGIEESTFNKVLERFYNMGISGLVRENVQNSLDGKIPECNQPVIVTIKTGEISDEEIPGINDVRERISCLQGQNNYTKETIDHMKNMMDQKEVSYISFEDFNTKGLTGAKNGQSNSKKDTWGIYAYNKGVHSEESDESLEKARGGSHGIGKIASNAASDLYIMYFANCDEDGNKHLGGTVQLIEHKYKDKFYRSTGYFTKVEQINENETKFYPYENNFNNIFKKDTRGLKIIIPFLREQFNNEKDIIKSICDSFFIAIIEKKLEVIVNDKVINSKTIKQYITNKDYYVQEISEIKEEFTPLYLNTYINNEPMDIEIEDFNREKYKFKLFFDYNEAITKGRVAIVRTIGMKIEDKKVKNNVNKPFNAVMIPNSIFEDAFLKSLENESHTELSFEHIKDQNLQKSAKRFINNISKEIAKIIEEEIKRKNPTDGFMNTKDILYTVENQFKQDLSESVETLKLNKGSEGKTITKIKVDNQKPKNPKDDTEKEKKKRKAVKRVKKTERTGESTEVSKEKRFRYKVKPDIVERLVVGDTEYVKFDFSYSDEIKKEKVCDVSMAVIDGMGEEYLDEFNMAVNYKDVIDNITGNNCKVENNMIKDLKINKGITQIKLKLNKNYNKALKFVYYVEV